MKNLSFLGIAVLCSFLYSCQSTTPFEQEVIVLRNARIFDVTDGAVIEQGVVVIRGSRIESVGREEEVSYPDGAKAIDLLGNMVLPGLIDLHIHAGASPGAYASPAETSTEATLKNLRACLYWGVTSVRSLWDDTELLLRIREEERKTRLASPRIFMVGPAFTVPGGYPARLLAGSPDLLMNACRIIRDRYQAGREVERLAALAVDAIKVVNEGLQFPEDCLTGVVEAAHRNGKQVLLHVRDSQDVRKGLDLGVDEIEHLPIDLDENLLERMVTTQAFWTPTFAAIEARALIGTSDGLDFLKEIQGGMGVPRAVASGLEGGSTFLKFLQSAPSEAEAIRLRRGLQWLRPFVRSGGRLGLGTDAGSTLVFHGRALHREMQLMVEAGLDPVEVLTAATRSGAEALGAGDRLGTLEPGKLADLIVVEGDPTRDIRDLSKLSLVIKGGVIYPRSVLSFEREYAEPSLVRPEQVFSDFDVGELVTRLGAPWTFSCDSVVGGDSIVEMRLLEPSPQGSRGALEIRGTLGEGMGEDAFWVAEAWATAKGYQALDCSDFSKLRFWARGTGHPYRLILGGLSDEAFTFTPEPNGGWVEIPFQALSKSSDPGTLRFVRLEGRGEPTGDFLLIVDSFYFE